MGAYDVRSRASCRGVVGINGGTGLPPPFCWDGSGLPVWRGEPGSSSGSSLATGLPGVRLGC
eukprot:2279696-Amphidinium_carterae.1